MLIKFTSIVSSKSKFLLVSNLQLFREGLDLLLKQIIRALPNWVCSTILDLQHRREEVIRKGIRGLGGEKAGEVVDCYGQLASSSFK